ncbi:MaoC/PaaZ C-terminal domain-containing protein [Lawsonibacter sp. LCP25S3_G6]|uniref:MaoC/PaaZ C-terminal domain-containing protein n=1 Tax=unclassified Lawsonibacter TaxID=2617946 RepID=UPI003F980D6F
MNTNNLTEVEKTVESIPMGQKAYYSKTVTEADVAIFQGITGDGNALSTNASFAARTPLGRCPIQSELLASFTWPVSTMIASPGAVTIGQELTFFKPVYVGDTVTVVGEVTKKVLEKKFVYVQTTIYNQNDEMVADGFVLELMRVHS